MCVQSGKYSYLHEPPTNFFIRVISTSETFFRLHFYQNFYETPCDFRDNFLTEKIFKAIISVTFLAWGDFIFLKEEKFIVAEKMRSDGKNV